MSDEAVTTNEQKSKRKKKTQLPSQQVMHGVGGTTLARRKLAERKKTSVKYANNEVINMTPILDPKDVDINNGTVPDPSSRPTYGLAEGITDPFLEELTYKDLDTLKELNCPMSRKKEIRAKLIAQRGEFGGKSKLSSDASVRWRRFRENTSDALRATQLWRSSIHEIEGRFGTGIRSYFAFLRWLFLLNLCIFFLIFIFVVVPTIAFGSLRSSGVISTISNATNVSAECQYNPYDPNTINSFPQYIIWWFTGQGFMENTLLFYGYYESIYSIVDTVGFYFHYDIPLAYLLVAFFYFLLSLVLLVRRAAKGIKESLVTDDRFYSYCNKVFSGWDFCIVDDNAAVLKHSSLKYELQTDLEEELIRLRQLNRTRKEKLVLYSKRTLINLTVLGILAASLAAIFYAAQYALTNGNTFDDNFVLDLLVTYLTSIVITIANFLAPMIFEFLVIYEDYTPDFTIRFTLVRTVVLRLTSVIFLYVVVYLQINCEKYDLVNSNYVANCSYCEGVQCWETYLGQEMYKLTLLDFFIVIAVTLFVEFPRKLIVENCHCGLASWWGHQEFSIPTNVLDIVYAQTVGWIGAFYAPLLPILVVVKFFIFFYVKKLTLLYNCRPATRPYRASRSGTFFYLILLFGFAVAVFPVIISVGILKPSQDCGPFRQWPTMFYAVTNSIKNQPQWAQNMFWFFGSSGFAAVLIVILCLILYYYFALSSAHRDMIALLKHQLMLEGKDKQFLLGRVNKLNQDLLGRIKGGKNLKANKSESQVSGISYAQENNPLPGQSQEASV